MYTKRTLTMVAAGCLLAAGLSATAAATGTSTAHAQARACTPAWHLVKTPALPSILGVDLGAPAVVSRSNVWFPSDADISLPTFHAGMLRWNGKSVTAAPEPAIMDMLDKSIQQASFDSSQDGWVLGSMSADANSIPGQAYLAHWNGTRWTIMPFLGPQDKATVEGHIPALTGVAAVSPADAWLVGTKDVSLGGAGGGAIIERWNGSTWSVVPNPASTPSSAGRLDTLRVISPKDVWAVGRQVNAQGTTVPLVERWNGRKWSIVPIPAGATPSALFAISSTGPNDVWVAGDQLRPGTADTAAPLVEHWNGKSWTMMSLPDLGAHGDKALGIYAASPDDVWVTNEHAGPQISGGTSGVFLHWNGTRWARVTVPGPQQFGVEYAYAGIAGTGPHDIWASGTKVSAFGSSAEDDPVIAHYSCV
jgi:hypothetical protein